jgi:hypothetical protein
LLSLELLLVIEFGNLILLGPYKLQYVVGIVYAHEKLEAHALFHRRNELSGLDEFSDRCLGVESSRYPDLHRVCNFLDLSEAILVYQSLCLMYGGPRTDSCNCRVVFGILENQANHSVYVPYGYI